MSIVIQAESISKRFFLKHQRSNELKVRVLEMLDWSRRVEYEEFWALKDVSFSIRHGEAVALVAGRVPLEASGGVRLDTIHAIAETGVTYVSVGRITQSAPAVDIGLDFSLS